MLASWDIVIQSEGATMWLDKVGWAGTPFDRKDCIHVAGRDQRGRRIELALSPRDGLQEAWRALLDSGVTPGRDDWLLRRWGALAFADGVWLAGSCPAHPLSLVVPGQGNQSLGSYLVGIR